MSCEQTQRSFSALLEDDGREPLDPAVATHLDRCDACHRAFETFCQTTELLRAQRVPATDDPSASAILRAVDLAAYEAAGGKRAGTHDRHVLFRQAMSPSTATRWRRLAVTHVSAAVAGAAAALLILLATGHLDPRPSRTAMPPRVVRVSTPPLTAPTVTPATLSGAELRFVSGAGSISRDGRAEMVDGSITVYPGEVVEIEVPELKVIEKRAPWLPVDLERIDIDRAQQGFDRSIDVVMESYTSIVDRLQSARTTRRTPEPPPEAFEPAGDEESEIVVPAPASREAIPAAPVQRYARPPAPAVRTPAVARTPIPMASRPAPQTHAPVVRAADPARSAPVVLRREASGRVSLHTQGPISEVVPRLLTFLEDEDRDVVSLVEDRLRLIRGQLARDRALADRFAASDRALTERRRPPKSISDRLLGRQPEPAPPPTPAVLWSHWWEANAMFVLRAESGGVF